MIIDENLLPSQKKRVNKETELSLVKTQQYYKKITFDIK